MVRQERRIARNPVFIGGRDRDRTCDPYHVKAVESDGIGMFRGLVPRNGPGSFDIGSGESVGNRCSRSTTLIDTLSVKRLSYQISTTKSDANWHFGALWPPPAPPYRCAW